MNNDEIIDYRYKFWYVYRFFTEQWRKTTSSSIRLQENSSDIKSTIVSYWIFNILLFILLSFFYRRCLHYFQFVQWILEIWLHLHGMCWNLLWIRISECSQSQRLVNHIVSATHICIYLCWHTRVKGEGLLLVLTQYVIVNRVLWEMSAYVACDERRTVIRLVHFQQYWYNNFYIWKDGYGKSKRTFHFTPWSYLWLRKFYLYYRRIVSQ